MTTARRVSAALCALTLVAMLSVPRPARAAGVTTHAWMALEAVELVSDPALAALLEANLGQLEGGAQFPDSGYWNLQFNQPGGDYGEESHWQRFFDAYAAQIRDDPACGDLTAPDGPCAPRIAHLMGAMAHGIGDEVWDWLFEPRAPDFAESYVPPALGAFFGTGGVELQMDIIAIHDHGRRTSPDTPPIPSPEDLVEVYASIGRTDITEEGLASGKGGMSIIRGAEPVLAQLYQAQVHANMARTSAGLVGAPGGVAFAARAIAGAYENMWGQLRGSQPRTEVTTTYPADGEAGVPATGWDRSVFLPGSSPGRGGARNRITAALSYSLPYVPDADDPSHVSAVLPPGAMTLRVADTGVLVPVKSGYPRIVPYNPDNGEHTIDLQPAENLMPCTDYRVDVTDVLRDHHGAPVTPASWTFRTDGCPGIVSGTVSSSGSGASLAGAWVAVLRASDLSLVGGGVADGAGAFSVAAPAGSYFVYVIDATGEHRAGFFGAPTAVTVTSGNVVDVDPQMAPLRGSIHATVTETGSGAPIPGVWGLALSSSAANPGATEVAVVGDGSGRLTLPGLGAGDHYVGFVDPAGGHQTRFWPDSLTVPAATPVAVAAGATTEADASLPAQTLVGTGSEISGTVTEAGTDTPLANARVFALRAADYRIVRAATTNAAGQYRLDLAAGAYKLAFLDADGGHHLEWFDDLPNTGLASAVSVIAPGTADAALNATTATMAGTVTDDPSGAPVAGAWVVAIGPTGIAGGAVTATDGTYTIAGLAPGTYRATFVDPNGGRTQEYHDNSPDYPGAAPINLTAAHTTTINAALALP